MKKLIFLILIIFSALSMSSAQLKIELKIINGNKIYQCEPILALYFWENISKNSIKIDHYPLN